MEAPKAEKPKDISHQFDFSDAESEAVTAAPKKRARTSPPVPVEALRPRKRVAKKHAGPSIDAAADVNVETAGGPEATSETREALEMVRQTVEESAWDKAIDDAKMKAKSEEDGLDDAEWEEKIAAAKKREEVRIEAAPKFEEKEEAWFKQGEDPEHIKAVAAKQHEAEGQKIEDVRRQIAETYDDKNRETILDTDEELDAAAGQAQAMIDAGDLNPEMFNAKDYRYLLLEQARLDKELEHAGWWKARKLHAEMRETRRQLDGYEGQIRSVIDGRVPSGALTAREKEDIRYKGPAPKQAMPQGSGTTLHREGGGTSIYQAKKPGLFARLFGKK